MVSSDVWDAATAARYDETSAAMFAPDVVGPAVDLLAALAGDGAALEFAVGTGRLALPLAARGVRVTGIDLSAPMLERLRAKDAAAHVVVALGDMATTRVAGEYAVVYLAFNTIGNLCTQSEQVACFRNAARHLRPGGRFVIEVGVPALRRLPPGQCAVPFHVGEDHLGLDTYDPVTQRATSHHVWRHPDGTARHAEHHFRYVWPAECDLMAQVAGLELERRSADWAGAPFTADSDAHVSIWRKPS